MQLLEKQRLRCQYNVSERYLQKTFVLATYRPGAMGEILIQLLECRLDALVLREGLAPTIVSSRQYVTHGHFLLYGRKATILFLRLSPGDVISVRPRSRNMVLITDLRVSAPVSLYLLSKDGEMAARFSHLPECHDIPVFCDL